MAHPVFRKLIPVYIVWFVMHVLAFSSVVFSQIMRGGSLQLDGSLVVLTVSHFLLIFLGIAFMVYMIVDCSLRRFPNDTEKAVWLVLIFFLTILGSIIYFYVHGKNPR
ncbi:MAG: PLDc N-terminal domain-containing protein [Nanoarchaeota archaeon]